VDFTADDIHEQFVEAYREAKWNKKLAQQQDMAR
jgi:hypothetical protein